MDGSVHAANDNALTQLSAHVEQHPQPLNTDLKSLLWETIALCFDQIS